MLASDTPVACQVMSPVACSLRAAPEARPCWVNQSLVITKSPTTCMPRSTGPLSTGAVPVPTDNTLGAALPRSKRA